MSKYYLVYEALADDPQATSTLQAVFTREGDAAEYERQKQERARRGWTYYTRVREGRGLKILERPPKTDITGPQ